METTGAQGHICKVADGRPHDCKPTILRYKSSFFLQFKVYTKKRFAEFFPILDLIFY